MVPSVATALYIFALVVLVFQARFGMRPGVVRFEKELNRRLSRPDPFLPWVFVRSAWRESSKRQRKKREREARDRAEHESRSQFRPDTLGSVSGGSLAIWTVSLWLMGHYVVSSTVALRCSYAGVVVLALLSLTVIARRLFFFRLRGRLRMLGKLPAFEMLALYASGPSRSRVVWLTVRAIPAVLFQSAFGAVLVPFWIVFLIGALAIIGAWFALTMIIVGTMTIVINPSSWLTRISNRLFPGLRNSPLTILSFWLAVVGAVLRFVPMS